MKIFMALKDRSLSWLAMQPEWPDRAPHTSDLVLHQMLQALDFLAFNQVVHRDVKPENILYGLLPGTQDYTFQLGDFGLCNQYSQPSSVVGTDQYKAPEVHEGDIQTPKVDIWSLAVTMLWILNTNEFRRLLATTHGKKPQYILDTVMKAVRGSYDGILRQMARIDAKDRPTAAQLLATHFQGNGLTTRGRIPPIVEMMDLDYPS